MKKSKKKVLWIVLAVLLALLLGAFLAVNAILGRIEKVPQVTDVVPPADESFETDPDGSSSAQEVDAGEVDWNGMEPLQDEGLINILLVGQDRREGQGRQRSDSMILCSINPETKQVSLISFLRDLYVQIPGGYSDNRLNTAYVFGGFPLIKEAFYTNFGLHIDGCFEVDFTGFQNVIDVLGGVDVTLTAREAEVVGVGSEAKLYHLDGKDALAYARIRKLDSDFGRTQRQRNVLQALYGKFREADAGVLMELFQEILPYLSTDMSNTQIMLLAAQCIPALGSIQLSSYCVPANDAFYYAKIRGMSVVVPDLEKVHQALADEYLPLSEGAASAGSADKK